MSARTFRPVFTSVMDDHDMAIEVCFKPHDIRDKHSHITPVILTTLTNRHRKRIYYH